MKKKIVTLLIAMAMVTGALAGCGSNSGKTTQTGAAAKTETTAGKDSKKDSEISVVSREDGSGTRGAFIELFGIEEKDASGEKIDKTTDEANITNSTEVMLTTVSSNDAAIGYISLGSLNDSVKALKIDGKEATVKNIKDGSYKIARPFNIATKDNVSDAAKDFINYIMSAEGQKIIEDNGYIAKADNAKSFTSTKAEGKIVVAGSSSVTPVMEKLIESYKTVNTKAQIELQESDSTTGMKAAADGTCDIGMASRDLKDTEKEAGLTCTTIAMDGIAVVVNKQNSTDNINKDAVKAIFTGETRNWSEVQ